MEWKPKAYKGGSEKKPVNLTQYEASTWVELPQFSPHGRMKLYSYCFDPKDTDRPQLRDTLLYYLDYALKGTVILGSKTYKAILRDARSSGDFSRLSSVKGWDFVLDIDVNGDGKFYGKSEAYDARKPFNIAGTTYELVDWTVNGSKLAIVKSKQAVAEIPPAPRQVPSADGGKMIEFTAKGLDGRTINLPSACKGKIVMLDLWPRGAGPAWQRCPTW